MAIQNETFGFTVRDNTTGAPLSGALVELRKGATIYTLTEKSTSGFYEIASIPTGKYSVFINSVDAGSTMGVGAGQVAALGNELDNIPVSTTTEYTFQDPTEYKTTLSLENVTNVAVPDPIAADANKVISVDSNGDYELKTISTSGFDTIFEVTTTAGLSEALAAEYDAKLIVINREDFNFVNTQSFEVWGSCSIMYGNTFEPFKWDSQSVNISFSYKAGADVALTGMMFLNGITAFEALADYTLNIPWKVTNLTFIGSDTFRSIGGTGNLIYEYVDVAIPASVIVTTTQDWWQNSNKNTGGGPQDLDSVLTEGNTSDKTISLSSSVSTGRHDFYGSGSNDGLSGLNWSYDEDNNEFLFRVGATNARDLVFSRYGDAVLRLFTSSVNLGAEFTGDVTFKNNIKGDKFLGIGDTERDNALSKWGLQSTYFPMVTEGLAIYGRNAGASDGGLAINAYQDGTSWKSIQAGECQLYIYSSEGNFIQYKYTAGSANASISWSEVYRVTRDGVSRYASTTNASPAIGDIHSDGQEVHVYQRGNQDNTAYDMNIVGANSTLLSSQDVSLCPFGFSQVANSSATDLPSGWATSGVSNVITFGHEPSSTTISQIISNGDRIAQRGSRTGTWIEMVTADKSGANTIINMAGLPTSATGLATGDLWNDSGTLKIA